MDINGYKPEDLTTREQFIAACEAIAEKESAGMKGTERLEFIKRARVMAEAHANKYGSFVKTAH